MIKSARLRIHPPILSQGLRSTAFVSRPISIKLTELCDRVLNVGDLEDRGFEFRPIFPFVDLEILHYPKMEYAYFPSAGSISQNECYVRIFVMKYIGRWRIALCRTEKWRSFVLSSLSAIPCRPLLAETCLDSRNCLEIFDPFSRENPFTTVSTEVFTAFALGSRRNPNLWSQIEGRRQSRRAPRFRPRSGRGGTSTSTTSISPIRLLGRSVVPDSGVFRIRDDEAVSGPGAPDQRLLPGDPAIVDIRRSDRRTRDAAGGADHDQRLCNPQTCRQPRDCPRRSRSRRYRNITSNAASASATRSPCSRTIASMVVSGFDWPLPASPRPRERLSRSPSRRANGRAPHRCGRPSAGRPGLQPRRAPRGGVAGPRRIAASVRAASRR